MTRRSSPRCAASSFDAQPGEWSHFVGRVLVPVAEYAVAKPKRVRRHPEVGFDVEQMPIRLAPVLPVLYMRRKRTPPKGYYRRQTDYGFELVRRPSPSVPTIVATIPNPLDFQDQHPTEDELGRYHRLWELLQDAPHRRTLRPGSGDEMLTPWEHGYEPCDPVTRMGGFSPIEANPDITETLEQMLPLPGGDEHFLLFDVNPSDFTGEVALVGIPRSRKRE